MNTEAAVLLVDDYATMRRIIRNLLRQIGLSDVEESVSGEEALTKLKDKKYDLVISDWHMEPMTGLELLKAVRADRELAGIPFMMVTAEASSSNVVAAKAAGVSTYIVKPFNAETLKSKLAMII